MSASRMHVAGYAAVALATFALGAGAIRRAVDGSVPGAPFDASSVERRKVESFVAQEEHIDLVLVGSSRVFRSIDTALLEAQLAAHGSSRQAFNFGLPGLRHLELRRWVDWILAREPPGLRTLVVELTGELSRHPRGWIHDENPWTKRAVEWHTAELSWLAARAMLASDAGARETGRALWSHLRHFGLRWSNAGLALPAVRRWIGVDPRPAAAEHLWSGFQALHDDAAMRRMQERAAGAAPWSELAREEFLGVPRDGTPGELLTDSFAALVERARSAGVAVHFVRLPPLWEPDVAMYTEAELHGLPSLVDFADPVRFPEFYTAENFYNRFHFNGRGAELFTHRVAAWLADALAE